MNIYDLLARLVVGRVPDFEQADALVLIENMRAMNVLGTVAHDLEVSSHQHVTQGEWWPLNMVCVVCKATVPIPPHDHRYGYNNRCRHCGQEAPK